MYLFFQFGIIFHAKNFVVTIFFNEVQSWMTASIT